MMFLINERPAAQFLEHTTTISEFGGARILSLLLILKLLHGREIFLSYSRPFLVKTDSLSTELLVTRLRQTINNLSDENKKQHRALQEERGEVKELQELLKSVSS